MSLYTLKEICQGCKFSEFNQKNGEFFNCKIDNEQKVNPLNGTCKKKSINKLTTKNKVG